MSPQQKPKHVIPLEASPADGGRIERDGGEFSSRHPGGAHILFGDGAVRFVSDSVDHVVYKALATRAGQELTEHSRF